MHKGVSFVVTVGREAAAFLTDPSTDPDARAGCLVELVETGQAQAGGSHVRRGQVAVKVLAVAPRHLAYCLLADEPRHRRDALARVLTCDTTLIVAVALAPADAPAVEWAGVPLALLEAAQAAQVARDVARWSPVAALAEEVA